MSTVSYTHLDVYKRQLLYLLLIADKAGIDLEEAARSKLEKNAAKYPIEKSYGSSRKYTQLDRASED